MSNLEKNISNFKKKLHQSNILTEDDINELESHIIDKVDDLKQNGLTETDAFNKTIADLGSIDEIAAEYSKVNLSANAKFILLCLGYSSISFILFILSFTTLLVSYFIKQIPSAYDYKSIPLFTPIMKLCGFDYTSYAALLIFIINTLIILLLLFFMFKKNNNLLSLISNIILSICSCKPAIKFITALLIITILLLTQRILSYACIRFTYNNTFNSILSTSNYVVVNIALVLSFTIRYMNSKTSDNTSSYLTLGYLLILIATKYIPQIILSTSIFANQFNLPCISILFIISFAVFLFLLYKMINKKTLESKPNIMLPAVLIICFIGSYFFYKAHYILPFIDYTLYSEFDFKEMNLVFIIEECLNLSAVIALFSANHKFSFHRKISIR